MKNIFIQSGIYISFVLFLTSCRGVRINTEYDSSVNFRSYKYYSICSADLNMEGERIDSSFKEEIKNRFINAVQHEMNTYYQLNDVKAELKIGFNLKTTDKKNIYRICDRPPGTGAVPVCHLDSVVYNEGTLLIYIADIKMNQIIWQSTITGIVNYNDLRNKKLIDKTIHRLFKEYPIENSPSQEGLSQQ